MYEQEHAERQAKEQEALEKQQAKDAEMQARQIEWARKAPIKIYSDPLHCYKRKDSLKDIAYAFGVDITGTVEELKKRIQGHMSSHPELETDKRYSGLFSKRKASKRAVGKDKAQDIDSDDELEGQLGEEVSAGELESEEENLEFPLDPELLGL